MKSPFNQMFSQVFSLISLASFVLLNCATAVGAQGQDSAPANGATPNQVLNAEFAALPGFRSWNDPALKPSSAMLCIHGLGLNSGAFEDFGSRMARNGVLVFAFDMRGFGAWMQKPDGDDLNFKGSLSDIRMALTAIRRDHPGMPVFLLGESMGGAIVLRACSEYPQLIDALISSAPGGQRYKEGRTDLEVGLRAITRPRKQFDVGKGIVDQATKNPALRKIWLTDPMNRLDLSALQLIKFQEFMDGNDSAVRKINQTPVLVLQGTLDELVKPDDTWKIFTNLVTVRKTFIALRSEHLVLEYGRAKSEMYDSKVAGLVAVWMRNAVSQASADDAAIP